MCLAAGAAPPTRRPGAPSTNPPTLGPGGAEPRRPAATTKDAPRDAPPLEASQRRTTPPPAAPRTSATRSPVGETAIQPRPQAHTVRVAGRMKGRPTSPHLGWTVSGGRVVAEQAIANCARWDGVPPGRRLPWPWTRRRCRRTWPRAARSARGGARIAHNHPGASGLQGGCRRDGARRRPGRAAPRWPLLSEHRQVAGGYRGRPPALWLAGCASWA